MTHGFLRILGGICFALSAAVLALEVPSGEVSVVMDSDTANFIDDQYALAWILKSPEKFRLEAVIAAPFQNRLAATPGDGMRHSRAEISRLFTLIGVPENGRIFCGAERFLDHPDDAVSCEGVLRIIELARHQPQSGGKLWILATGALTDTASALRLAPDIRDRIAVVWLGGDLRKELSEQEFNWKQDPIAAAAVFRSGVPLVWIPAGGVAEHLKTTLPELRMKLASHTGLGRYLYRKTLQYQYHTEDANKTIWDIAVPAWFLVPEAFTWAPAASGNPVTARRIQPRPVFEHLFRSLAK